MNIRPLILFLTLTYISVAHVYAEDASAEDRVLLEKLRADDFDERAAARTKLLKRGEAVRDLITTELARPDLDADYKTNLKSIATGLAELDILKPFDNPKRADFEFKNETIESALKKISEAFGQTVNTGGGAGSKVITLSLKQTNFIEAVEVVRAAAGLKYAPKFPELTMSSEESEANASFANLTLIMPPGGAAEIVALSGPFALALDRLAINRQPSEPSAIGRANAESLRGSLYFGQDVHVLKAKIASLKAVDGATEHDLFNLAMLNGNRHINSSYVCRVDFGKSAVPAPFVLGLYTDFISPPAAPLPSGLKWKLGLIIEIDLTSTEERIELDNLKQGTPRILGVGIVTVHSLESLSGGWALECSVPRDVYAGRLARDKYIPAVSDVVTASRITPPTDDIQLLDEKGDRLAWTRIGAKIERNVAGIAYRLTMKTASKPAAIIFKHTTKSVQREFEFEFPSVPIPLNKAVEK